MKPIEFLPMNSKEGFYLYISPVSHCLGEVIRCESGWPPRPQVFRPQKLPLVFCLIFSYFLPPAYELPRGGYAFTGVCLLRTGGGVTPVSGPTSFLVPTGGVPQAQPCSGVLLQPGLEYPLERTGVLPNKDWGTPPPPPREPPFRSLSIRWGNDQGHLTRCSSLLCLLMIVILTYV